MSGAVLDFPIPDTPITERERRFAVAYFEVTIEIGRDLGAALPAYRRAFPSAQIEDADAARLVYKLTRSPAVIQLVDQLRRDYAARAACPPEHITEQLERIAFSNPLDFGRINEAGQFEIDLRNVTHDQMVALKEIKVSERVTADGEIFRTTTLKLHSSLDALDKLARIHGMYIDPNINISANELMRVITNMRRRMGRQEALPAP
jgi:hypothetical protein